MAKAQANILSTISLYIFYGLLAYMPLHILISTVLGVNVGYLDTAKVLKDAVLMFGFCLLFVVSITKPWFKEFITHKITIAIGLYALLTLSLALLRPTDQDAEILGVVYNLRFMLFFLYAWLLSYTFPAVGLRNTALRIVLAIGTIVVSFGIIQYLFLPNDALSQLGFTRANGVLPAFFIDDKPNLERVMSTLRDPNSLGSYLIIILALITGVYLRTKDAFKKNMLIAYGLASLACLYFTFSRSAWIGVLVAGLVFAALLTNTKVSVTKKMTLQVSAAVVAFLVVAGIALFSLRNTYFVQNTIFHADSSTVEEDPNELRVRFVQESVENIKNQPLGTGPGTAGLASIKNQVQGTQLNENYYLQIASEVGIIGLLVVIAILVVTAYMLYTKNSGDLIVIGLLASFAGLAFTNLLVHIWSNEAVAYTWWGLAGLYVVSLPIVKKKAEI